MKAIGVNLPRFSFTNFFTTEERLTEYNLKKNINRRLASVMRLDSY